MIQRQGLYLSYDEGENGPFLEAVEISNHLGCVTWFDRFHLRPERLAYPTDVIIRLTSQERYFRGILLAVAAADTLAVNFSDGERNHRPAAWQRQRNDDFKSVLFISRLQEVSRPREVEHRSPPQHPTYVDL